MLYITLINTDISDAQLRQLTVWLTATEQKKLVSFTKTIQRYRYATSRALTRMLLAERLNHCNYLCEPYQLNFTTNNFGKPELKLTKQTSQQWHFNISHSGDYVVLAIANHPVGIDIETTPQHNIDIIVNTLLTNQERDWLHQAKTISDNHYQQEFLKIWTAKEAVLKAHGCGLHRELSSFTLSPSQLSCNSWYRVTSPEFNQYSLILLPAIAGHQAAVSIAQTQPEISCQYIDPNKNGGLIDFLRKLNADIKQQKINNKHNFNK